MDRAPYSPSTLPYLELCPGWKSDPTPGPQALRGTAIHGLLSAHIKAQAVVAVAEDLREPFDNGVAMFADLKARFPEHTWLSEETVTTSWADVYGTADLVGVSEWAVVAVLVDWKTGRGDRDDASRNLQLIAYAIGILLRWPHIQEVLLVMGELEQAPSECTWSREDLINAGERIAKARAAALSCTTADLRPGERQCHYCGRGESCAARSRVVTETAAKVPADPLAAVSSMTPAELGAALRRFRPAAKVVEHFVGALEERAKALLAVDPKALPGFALKAKNGKREWTAPDDVVRRALGTTGAKLEALVSPAEAEKRIAEALGPIKGAKARAEEAVKGLCAPTKGQSLVEA